MRLDSTIQRLPSEAKFLEKYEEHWEEKKAIYREQNAVQKAKTGKYAPSKRGMTRRAIDRRNRQELILKPLDVSCEKCALADRGLLDVAHKVPVALGGSDDRENLMVLCTACHLRHDHMVPVPRRRK